MERLFGIDEILAYIEEKKRLNVSSTHQLSMYYEATQKELEPSEKTLKLWEGYISLLEENGYTSTEIREVYKMLKIKYWKFLSFWRDWMKYEQKAEGEPEERIQRVHKLIEGVRDILRYKNCPEKDAILGYVQGAEERISGVQIEKARMILGDCEKENGEQVGKGQEAQGQHSFMLGLTSNILDINISEKEERGATQEMTQEMGGEVGIGTDWRMKDKRAEHKRITMNGKKLKILRTIGRGGSSKVYQVMTDKNEVFALKKIKIRTDERDEELYRNYANEIDLLKRMRGRKEIVSLRDSYINRDCIAILMEYGEVDLGRFLEEERQRVKGGYRKGGELYMVKNIWEQMLRAVKCIHEFRIVHRDLKPANFLFVGGRLKLIDFGISKEIKNDTTNIIREKQIGTINYMSPEAIKEGKTKMGRSSDMWSLGCILYEMYFGESPFMRFKSLVQRMQKLLDPEYEVEYFPREEGELGYNVVVREIRRCLIKEPKSRGKIDDLLESEFLLGSSEGEPRVSFNRREMQSFVEKIMDLKHGATRGEGRRRIVEKITELYFT